MAFFQRFWSLLKEDILVFMEEFHERGKLSKGMGASFITLIPEKGGETSMRDFRPISLIGSIYKILAKVLAGRLQKVGPCIISKEQGTFVSGRRILDGILVANECVHSRNKERKPGLICRLDLEKAYVKEWIGNFYNICFEEWVLGRNGEVGFKNVSSA